MRILNIKGIQLIAVLLVATPVAWAAEGIYSYPYNVSTIAGTYRVTGAVNGPGPKATFNYPYGVAVDGVGNIYVADSNNNMIRKINTKGVVSTIAGGGLPGIGDFADGVGTKARFNTPADIALDSDGNLYVADRGNYAIRMINPKGVVSTIAGTPKVQGYADGAASSALFNRPYGIAVDSSRNIYVSECVSNTIRKISNGQVTTLAGTKDLTGTADGKGAAARFNQPLSLAVDYFGSFIYVADSSNTIRKISAKGEVTTIAGSAGTDGYADRIAGSPLPALFSYVSGLAVDQNNNVFVAEANALRKITPDGGVTTIAGSGTGNLDDKDGVGSKAVLYPDSITLDASGNLFFGEVSGQTIRKAAPLTYSQTIDFAALSPTAYLGQKPVKLTATSSSGLPVTFSSPQQGTLVSISNNLLSFLGTGNVTITASQPGNTSHQAATPVSQTILVSANPVPIPSYQWSVFAKGFYNITGIGLDADGNLYVTDSGTSPSYTNSDNVPPVKQQIAMITPDGKVKTLVKKTSKPGSDFPNFVDIQGLAIDSKKNLFMGDIGTGTLLQVARNLGDEVISIAGQRGVFGDQDGKLANEATLEGPSSLVFDSAGNLYVADAGIRKIDFSTLTIKRLDKQTNGGLPENIGTPVGLAVDSKLNVYCSDFYDNTIKKVSQNGTVSIYAGKSVYVKGDYIDGPGAMARFAGIDGIAADANDILYVADYSNNVIRRVNKDSFVTSISTPGKINRPSSIAADPDGNLYVGAEGVIYKGTPPTIGSFPSITKTFGDAPFKLVSKPSPGISVSYSSPQEGSLVSIKDNVVTILSAGNVTITASNGGDSGDISAVPPADFPLTIKKADQKITFKSLPSVAAGSPAITLSASASSGAPVTFTSSQPNVATVSGNTVTVVGKGTTTITASQPGNSNYNPAPDAPKVLTVK